MLRPSLSPASAHHETDSVPNEQRGREYDRPQNCAFGILGCGVIGPHNAKAIAGLTECEPVAVAWVVPNPPRSWLDEHECAHHASLEETRHRAGRSRRRVRLHPQRHARRGRHSGARGRQGRGDRKARRCHARGCGPPSRSPARHGREESRSLASTASTRRRSPSRSASARDGSAA